MLKSAEVTYIECEDHTDSISQIKYFSLICPPVWANIKIRERCSQIHLVARSGRTRVVRAEEIRCVSVIKE